VPLHGEPIVTHALRGVLACQDLRSVVVVAPPQCVEDVDDIVSGAVAASGVSCSVAVVPGGAERAESVARGLAALPAEVGIVLVHDAARALVPAEVFDRVVHAVRAGHMAVVPVLPVTDTIKTVAADDRGDLRVTGTLDRASLRAVQTPQGFLRATLERAHADADDPATDDAALVEQVGGWVHVVDGDPRAMKITTPHDLEVASLWLDGRRRAAGHEPPVSTRGGRPVLVVLGGAPGVGKTSVARELAARRAAAHVRVDTLEQALLRARGADAVLGPEGYAAGQAVAADLLRSGLDVVADGTQRLEVMRRAWASSADAAGARVVQVELVCSDEDEHRRRVEQRSADIPGHRLPGWPDVEAADTDPWPDADARVDTSALSVAEVVDAIEEIL
jgi:2-C-methyl-D-erythritol 4-phosphate cytidylyltransferase